MPAKLRAATDLGTLPAVIVGIGSLAHPDAALVDVVASGPEEAIVIADAVAQRPIASTAPRPVASPRRGPLDRRRPGRRVGHVLDAAGRAGVRRMAVAAPSVCAVAALTMSFSPPVLVHRTFMYTGSGSTARTCTTRSTPS